MRFSNIIKPTHQCNMACGYCYLKDSTDVAMSVETLRNVVRETFAYPNVNRNVSAIDFIWHGGEPLTVDVEFYNTALKFQKEHQYNTVYYNHIQTNGTLLDKNWVSFFKENKFYVSISIDGPSHINDKSRVFKNGNGSFDKIYKGISLLKEAGIALGVCVVLSKKNNNYVDEIYNFLVKNKLNFNIIPLNRSGSASDNYSDFGLDSGEYAKSWIQMYDHWFYATDNNYVYCSDFAQRTRAVVGSELVGCTSLECCSLQVISIDPRGNVYSCATMTSDPEWRYGNINTNSLEELLNSEVAKKLQLRPVNLKCHKCKWHYACHGGCVGRAIKFYNDPYKQDFYCRDLYKMYEHIEQCLKKEGITKTSFPDYLESSSIFQISV